MQTKHDNTMAGNGGEETPWQRRYTALSVGVAFAVLIDWAWLAGSAIFLHGRAPYDDAYMFWRYAMNMRHGFGMAWNPGGGHTFGETALLWGFVVWLVTFLPVKATVSLMAASWVCSVAAPVVVAKAVSRVAASGWFASWWRVLPFAVLPLLPVPRVAGTVFVRNTLTGMETMLALCLMAGFVGLVLAWQRGLSRAEAPALVGVLLFVTRPESAIAVVLLPGLVAGLMGGCSWQSVLRLYGWYAAGVVLVLVACRLYFGTAFPLGFYVKSAHAYEGYRLSWHPMRQLATFLRSCRPFLVVLALAGRRREWRLIVCCLIPALAVFAYLGTVNQIMGFQARYYLPYLALFAIPALLVLDRRVAESGRERLFRPSTALVHAAILLAVLLPIRAQADASALRNRLAATMEPTLWEYDPVQMDFSSTRMLPLTPPNAIADHFIGLLPPGTVVAASEVGYLAAASPQADILDLEGLNDTGIALHGFSMDALLARKPDVIWLPHGDYTWQLGVMLSDPRLLEQYDLYAKALGLGIALRKDSRFRVDIENHFQSMWKELYSGYPMEDYRVRSVSWSGQKHLVPLTTDCDVCK